MIDHLMEVMQEQIESFMRLKIRDTREQYLHLVPVLDQDGKSAVTENTICMSLVKIEEEKTNMSDGTRLEHTVNGTIRYRPPVILNLYVLFSASASDGQEKNYREALKRISRIIAFFQSKNVFTSANTPDLDPSVGKVAAELVNMNMEEQNNLWSMLGGMYRPSVLYKFRSMEICEKRAQPDGGPVLEKELALTEKE